MILAHMELMESCGVVSNISTIGKKKLAKQFIKRARERYHFNMAEGSGIAIISVYIESLTLSTEDAKFVELMLDKLVSL